MWKLYPLKNVTPFFPVAPYKIWGPVKTPFLKTYLEVQPLSPQQKVRRRGGGVHYLSKIIYCEITPLNRDKTLKIQWKIRGY